LKATEYIDFTINRLPKGYIFTYGDFNDYVNSKEAIIKALNRMVASGKIAKVAKGKFYKPEKTVFGVLNPNKEQVVKDLLEKNGKLIGYLTGTSVYNSLGLSTQVSNTLQIGRNDSKPPLQRGPYKVRFIAQKNTITKHNIPLLQLLDSIKYIKKIPDAAPNQSVKRLLALIAELNEDELATLLRLSMKYPPSTRAILGAIFDELGVGFGTQKLLESLNHTTTAHLHAPRNG